MIDAETLRDIADRLEEERPIVDDLVLALRQLVNGVPWEIEDQPSPRGEAHPLRSFFVAAREAQAVLKRLDAFIAGE